MRTGLIWSALCFGLALVGCRGAREVRSARLDGTYGVAHAGTVEPVLKVQAVPGGGY